jgi:hypothetical protein
VGGACLLGVRGLVVICHGNSSRKAIANALLFGAEALRKGILPGVVAELERAGVTVPAATDAGAAAAPAAAAAPDDQSDPDPES